MFTGLIQAVCPVEWVRSAKGGREVAVKLGPLAKEVEIGSSVALSGVCSTITRLSGPTALFHLTQETLKRTWFDKGLTTGVKLNIELALKLSQGLEGHLVQGHVDCTGRVVEWDKKERFSVSIDQAIEKFIAQKGSIALDGVSLTVVSIQKNIVQVALIPHTAQVTTLGDKRPGQEINVEVDLIARYVERLMGERG